MEVWGFCPRKTLQVLLNYMGRMAFTWAIHLLFLRRRKKKRNSVLAFSVFQVHLTQKGQHARATYLGVVYSASLHW